MAADRQWVFGYGSLVDLERLAVFLGRELPPEEVVFGRLRGFRRTWNVATDNRLDLPGYKIYLDPETGEQPAAFVTFLNLRRVANEEAVNGVAFRVSEEELERIQGRERNYRLTEVTRHWQPEGADRGRPGRLLTSLGRPEARARFAEGRKSGRAVVRPSYRQIVHGAFRNRGRGWWREYRATTDPPDVPERALERVELA